MSQSIDGMCSGQTRVHWSMLECRYDPWREDDCIVPGLNRSKSLYNGTMKQTVRTQADDRRVIGGENVHIKDEIT